MGHLSSQTTIQEYNGLIQALIQENTHRVYLYRFGIDQYSAVRGVVQGREWLVIATKEGIMERPFLRKLPKTT